MTSLRDVRATWPMLAALAVALAATPAAVATDCGSLVNEDPIPPDPDPPLNAMAILDTGRSLANAWGTDPDVAHVRAPDSGTPLVSCNESVLLTLGSDAKSCGFGYYSSGPFAFDPCRDTSSTYPDCDLDPESTGKADGLRLTGCTRMTGNIATVQFEVEYGIIGSTSGGADIFIGVVDDSGVIDDYEWIFAPTPALAKTECKTVSLDVRRDVEHFVQLTILPYGEGGGTYPKDWIPHEGETENYDLEVVMDGGAWEARLDADGAVEDETCPAP